ncbi:MAG: hypothetical protein JRI25_15040 [Deltaproteobacteria bacterium]|nr:hypothetical protein [Deltaproteobacteria bacterium]
MYRNVSLFFVASLLAACFEPTESTGLSADVVDGECLVSAYDRSDAPYLDDTAEPADDPSVSAEVDGSDILVYLHAIDANCCPSPAADVTLAGSDITVDFVDVTNDDVCDCECISDFTVEIGSVDPGTYDITVLYYGSVLGEVEVYVP